MPKAKQGFHEKRENRRRDHHLLVFIINGTSFDVANICHDGCLLQTPINALAIDQDYPVYLAGCQHTKDCSGACDYSAMRDQRTIKLNVMLRPIRQNPDGSMGCIFTTTGEEQRAVIDTLVHCQSDQEFLAVMTKLETEHHDWDSLFHEGHDISPH